jgi:hypothetical protein
LLLWSLPPGVPRAGVARGELQAPSTPGRLGYLEAGHGKGCRPFAANFHHSMENAGDVKELKDATPTEREVLDAVMKWKQRRKPPLDEKDAAVAIRNLAALGWIDVLSSCDLPLQSDPVYEAMICE